MPVTVSDIIKPKNGNSFPIVEATDVLISEGLRLNQIVGAPTITVTASTYIFDVADIIKNVKAELSHLSFGSTLVYLEEKNIVDGEPVYSIVSSTNAINRVVEFNLNSIKNSNATYRLRAINSFGSESISEEFNVIITSLSFGVSSTIPSLVAYDKSTRTLELNFEFSDPIRVPTGVGAIKSIHFVVNGIETQIEVGDSGCFVQIPSMQNGPLELTYCLQYTLEDGNKITTKAINTNTYALERGGANFGVDLPTGLTSSSYWNINLNPIFDTSTYTEGCLVKIIVSENELPATYGNEENTAGMIVKTIRVGSTDLFNPIAVGMDPIDNTEERNYYVYIDVYPLNSFNKLQNTNKATIAVSVRDLRLVMHYDASVPMDKTSSIWPNRADSERPMKLYNIGAINQDTDSKEIIFSGDAYGEASVGAFPLDVGAGFTVETYVKSDFLGNLSVSSLNIGDIININYDKVKFNYADVSSVSEVFASRYHHIALVYDTTSESEAPKKLNNLQIFNNVPNLKIYIDGVLSAAVPVAQQPTLFEATNLFVNKFKGPIDYNKNKTYFKYIKFYESPLTAADIYQNYIMALPMAESTKVQARNNLDNVLELWFVRSLEGTPQEESYKGPITFNTLHKITQKEPKNDQDTSFTSKNSWVNCDVYYKLPISETNGEAVIQQTDYKTRIRLQGTSTLAYPVKNYRFNPYSAISSENPADANAKNYISKFIQPPGAPESWVQDKQFTLKCDFMESSHRNNTPTARFYHESLLPAVIDAVHGTKTEMERMQYYSPARKTEVEIEGQKYHYRDSIDGYPCVVYYIDDKADLERGINANNVREYGVFAGSYMFNTDKEGAHLGFDLGNGQEMVSYEGGTNTDIGAAAFKTWDSFKKTSGEKVTSISEYFEKSIEARFSSINEDEIVDYNDNEQIKRYLTRFNSAVEFLNSPDNPLNKENPTEEEIASYKAAFTQQFNYAYCMAYYIQMMLFAQVDSAGKNAMFDYWGTNGQLYIRPYDMDTQVGLDNFGYDRVPIPAAYNDVLMEDSTKYVGNVKLTVSSDLQTLMYTQEGLTPIPFVKYEPQEGEAKVNDYTYSNGDEDNPVLIIFNKPLVGDSTYYIVIQENSVETAYYDIVSTENTHGEVEFNFTKLTTSIAKRLPWSTKQSVLWKTFAKLFAAEIVQTYGKLRNDSRFTVDAIDEVIRKYSTDIIGETIYNADAAKRYLGYKDGKEYNAEYYRNIQGNRNVRYYKYLRDRIKFLDSYFNITESTDSANFRNHEVKMVTNTLVNPFYLEPKLYSPSYVRVNVDQGGHTVVCIEFNNEKLPVYAGAANKNMTVTGLGNAYEIPGISSMLPSDFSVSRYPDLIKLDLSSCSSLSGQYSITNKPYLTELNISRIKNPELGIVVSNTPSLAKILGTNSELAYLNLPSNLSSLEELNLAGTTLKRFSIENNTRLTLDSTLKLQKESLEALSISKCPNIAPEVDGKKNLTITRAEYGGLKSLSLAQNSIHSLTLSEFAELDIYLGGDPTLEKLTISNCSLKDTVTKLDLSGFTNLKELSLVGVIPLAPTCELILPTSLEAMSLKGVKFTTITTALNVQNGITVPNLTYDFNGITLTHYGSGREVISENTIVEVVQNLNILFDNTVGMLQRTFYRNTQLQDFINCKISCEEAITAVIQCFAECTNLKSLPDMSGIVCTNIYDATAIFNQCVNLPPQPCLDFLKQLSKNRATRSQWTKGIQMQYFMSGVGSRGASAELTYNLDLADLPKYIERADSAFGGTQLTEIFSSVPLENFATITIQGGNSVGLSNPFGSTQLEKIPNNFFDYFAFEEGARIPFLFQACKKLDIEQGCTLVSPTHPTFRNIGRAEQLFRLCQSLTNWDAVNIIPQLPGVENFSGMYQDCISLKPVLIKHMFNSPNMRNVENLFLRTALHCNGIPQIFGPNCTNLEYASGMFAYTAIEGTIDSGLFEHTKNLKSIGIGAEGRLDTQVIIAPGIFTGVTGITQVDDMDISNSPIYVDIKALLHSGLTNLTNVAGIFANISDPKSHFGSLQNQNVQKFNVAINFPTTTSRAITLIENTVDTIPSSIANQQYMFANTKLIIPTSESLTNYISPNVIDLTGAFMKITGSTIIKNLSFNNLASLRLADYVFADSKDIVFQYQDEYDKQMFGTNVESANYTFSGCTGFKNITFDTFANATNLRSAIGCFQGSGITSLPDTPAYIFLDWDFINNSGSNSLTGSPGKENSPISAITLPEGLFRNCGRLETIDAMFANCKDLQGAIPASLLLKSQPLAINSITSLFSGCERLGTVKSGETNISVPKRALDEVFMCVLLGCPSDVEIRLNTAYDVLQNIGNFNLTQWTLNIGTEDGKRKMLLSLNGLADSGSVTEDKWVDSYIVPDYWLSSCPSIRSLEHVFANVAVVATNESRVIDDRLFKGIISNVFAQPIEQNLLSINSCFARVPIIGGTILTNDFLRMAHQLRNAYAAFYQTNLKGLDGCFTSPMYPNTGLQDVSFLFYVKSECAQKIETEEDIPDFSKIVPIYFSIPTSNCVYNPYIFSSSFVNSYGKNNIRGYHDTTDKEITITNFLPQPISSFTIHWVNN